MFSKEYITGKFLVRFCVHRTYAKSEVQSQSWPSFSTGRQHSHARGRLHHWEVQRRTKTSVSMLHMTIAGVISWHTPTTEFAWNMTHVRVCFIMSTIQFVNLWLVHSAIFSCVLLIAFLINGEVQLMPIKDSSIYLRGPFLVQKLHQFYFTLWRAQGTVDINWSFLWWTCDSVCNFWLTHKSCYSLWSERDHCRLSLSLMASALVSSRPWVWYQPFGITLRAITRTITRSPRSVPISQLLSNLHWLHMHKRIKFKVATLT